MITPYFQTDDVTLYCGDCLEILPTLGKVDALVTDPPYGVSFSSNMRKATDSLGSVANDERPFIWFLHHASRCLGDDGCAVVFHRWDVAETWASAVRASGLEVKSQIVWSKGGGGMGDLKRQFSPSHEPAWFACKKKFAFRGGRPGTSVFVVPKVPPAAMVHPTEKPSALFEAFIPYLASESGIVLDPFMGAGATGVACVKTGRKFIGIELDPAYCEIAKQRIEKAIAERAASLHGVSA